MNNQDYKFSVIVPTYNRRNWIAECLDSILAQTYKNFEIIVVDDGSTDGTADWIRSQQKYKTVRVFEQENAGASNARNYGISVAKGNFITFIDSDDLLLPTHLEKAVEIFEQCPDTGLFCCDSKMIDTDGKIILDGKTWHQSLSEYLNVQVETGFRPLEQVFMFSNCFPGFTFKKEALEKLGGFEQSIFPADDYDLALRVAGSEFKVFYLNEALCLRREHDGQCSGIRNSVKTCIKLREALEDALQRNPALRTNGVDFRRRLADISLELAVSQIKEGKPFSGIKTMAKTVVGHPAQMNKIISMARRKVGKRASA